MEKKSKLSALGELSMDWLLLEVDREEM